MSAAIHSRRNATHTAGALLQTREVEEVVPQISTAQWNRHRAALCEQRAAVLIRRAVASTDLAEWTLEAIRARCGGAVITASTALPRHGVPYAAADEMHDERLELGKFIDHLACGGAGYLTQAPLSDFSELAERAPVGCPKDEHCHAVNLWIGGLTRSGFHYDSADNLFVQLAGMKRVMLSPSRRLRDLYPFPDNYSKSTIDFERPDWRNQYPKTNRARIQTLIVDEGDVLYIPRGWWHYLATDHTSVSINIWFGRSLTVSERMRRFTSAGPSVWRQVARDFALLGVLGRPYDQRPYSPPPAGLRLARTLGLARHAD